MLHRISIQVAPEHLEALETDLENRVPCDITIDGVRLSRAGIRKKGWRGSMSPLDQKPAFSLKLDAFVPGQTWEGLDRLLLNNALQDPSLLNEHLAYALYRRAGLVAPRTAHAVVEFNGRVLGFYVMREAFDKTFLRRAFGSARGNLYEGNCCVDFAEPLGSPALLDLKDEEEGRSRGGLEDLAQVVEETPDSLLPERLDEVLDLDGFLTSYALEAALAHWDGYSLNLNNYYLYHRPQDGKFVFLPHGMDQLLDRPTLEPFHPPRARLPLRIRDHAALDARFRARLRWVVSDVWRDSEIQALAEEVHAVIASAPLHEPAVRDAFEAFLAAWTAQVERFPQRRAFVESRLSPPSGR